MVWVSPAPPVPREGGWGGLCVCRDAHPTKARLLQAAVVLAGLLRGGQLRPGQYALPPRSGVRVPPAVVDVTVRGCDCPTHVQAWRGTGEDGGYNFEADVVRYNAGSGNNRLPLVPDFLVENIKLRNSTNNDRDDGGGAQYHAENVKAPKNQRRLHHQRRLRRCALAAETHFLARARDTTRRNAKGLCQGSRGEIRAN